MIATGNSTLPYKHKSGVSPLFKQSRTAILRKSLMALTFLFFTSLQAFSQTGTAVTMAAGTNNATAFGANTTLGSDGATYYVSWDATYLYLGWTGGNSNYWSDLYYAAIDTDPFGVNGSTNQIDGVGFQTGGRRPNFYVVYENNGGFYGPSVTDGNAFEIYQNNSGNWSFVSRTGGNNNIESRVVFGNPAEIRLRIAWATLGSFSPGPNSPIGITMWTNNANANFMWGRWPTANPGTGSTPITLTHSVIFPSTAGSVNTSTAGTSVNFNRTLTPSSQPTMTAIDNISGTSLRVNWSGAGNGQGRVVVIRPTSAGAVAPTNGTGYTANANIASAPTTGANNFVVYSGTDASGNVTVTGLSTNTAYTATMYEYNGAASIRTYNTTSPPSQAATTSGATINVTGTFPLAFGNQCINTTSSNQTFSVNGSNLTADLILTPPVGFEISTSPSSGFVANPSTLSLTPSGGTVSATTIYVRFSPASATSFSANITAQSTGATTQNVAVTGTGNSLSVGGTASSNQTVCSGNQPANITLTGHTGTIQWQRSSDAGFTSPTNIGTNSTTLTGAQVGSITSVTYVRAVVTSGACSPANSNTITISVSSSVGGTATATAATVCPGVSTTITLTGHTGSIQWQRSTGGLGVWTDIAGATSTTLITGPLNMFTEFRARVTNGSCATVSSTTATVSVSDLNTSTAAPTVYNTWDNADNDLVAGFGAWALTGGGSAGFFIGATTDNDDGVANLPNSNTGGRGWGMFANSSQTASAIRPITGNLSIGQTITYSMDNGSVQTGGTVGMGLQNASGNNLMELYFVGGQEFYTVNDATGTTNTTIGFTRGGIEVSITRSAATTYTIRIVRKEDGSSQTLTGRSFFNATGGQVPAQIRFFNFNAGAGSASNVYFNSLGISTPLITTQPATGTQTLNLGEDGTALTVVTNGTVTGYQWFRNTTNSNSGGTAVGTSASHTPNETTAGTYYYYVTVTGACGSATSNPSGAITVNNTNVWTGGTGNWNVGGNWSAGTVPSGDQTIVVNSGTPTLNVDFTVTTGSLTISNPATLIIGPTGRLSKTGGIINFNGRPVTIASNAGGTGSIGQIQGSAIAGATNVTVQRFIPAKRAWRMLTAPVIGGSSNSIFANWQNSGQGVTIWAPAPVGEANPSGSNSGILAGGVASSILRFDGTAWAAVTNTNTNNLFGESKGTNQSYAIFVTAPFSGSGTGPIGGAATSTTLQATGELQQGDVSFGSLPAGFHLIGNPYASPVNLSGLASNTNRSFYIWDARGDGLGVYRTWENDNWVAPPLGNNYGNAPIVQSGQAFFINLAGNASVNFTEASKVGNTANNVGFRIASVNDQRFRLRLNRLVNNVLEERDVALARFDASYSPAFVASEDIVKMVNFGENLSLLRSGTDLVVERRPLLQPTDTLQLRIWNMAPTNYQLQISPEDMQWPAGTTAVLQDLFTSPVTEVALSPSSETVYNFSVTSNSASSGNRFRIVFRTNIVTSVRDLNAESGYRVYPNPVNSGGQLSVQFRNQAAGKYTVTVFNMLGMQVQQQVVSHGGGTAVQSLQLREGLPAGTYVAEITAADGKRQQVKLNIQ